jgi:outer membrane lipoprotein-sorting protein
MYKNVIAGAILGFLFVPVAFYGQSCQPGSPASQVAQEPAREPANTPANAPSSPVDTVLEGLQKKAAELKSYECNVDYVVRQPLLESQTRRTGVLYYARFDQRSYLRIDFRTFQQDQEKEQAYREQFIFDGVWLQRIDYQTQSIERRQITEPNKPVDAFALVSRQVPVFGFAKIEDLRKQFDIDLVADEQPQPSPFHHLHLKVKPDSTYKEDYTTIDFWVDKKLGLPAKITAVGAEADVGDVYDIKLLQPKVNQGIDKSVFQVSPPAGFSIETIPLEKKQKAP